MWTRTELIDEAREAADARGSGRWTPTTLLHIGDVVYRQEWKFILEANQFYRAATRSVTPDSSGLVSIADLSTATEKLFRIIAVGDTIPWEGPLTMGMPWFSNDISSYSKSWYITGDGIQLLPGQVHSGIRAVVNHRPPLISEITANASVEFPEGYEYILALEMAALMLNKGGAESNEGIILKGIAETIRGNLLGEVQRTTTQPLRMMFGDPREHYDS